VTSLDRYFGLEGKVALVVGATGGIGTEISRAFAAAGARLVLSSNDDTACDVLAEELGAKSRPADVRNTAELDGLLDATGAVDVLVCNAGISGHFGPLGEATEENRAEIFDVNLNPALHLSGKVAPVMAARGGGSIILMSSIAGLRGNARLGLYGLTKAALAQLARNLAVEWGPQGVRANAIAPGLIRTSWADAILSSPDKSAARLGETPLRRIGEPWEVAATALFLASPAAAFITGQTIVVDGGTLISDGT
jgi:NAD(P)-dependent dehydrogenase (short-subunit alcohol dehydrogenase family)